MSLARGHGGTAQWSHSRSSGEARETACVAKNASASCGADLRTGRRVAHLRAGGPERGSLLLASRYGKGPDCHACLARPMKPEAVTKCTQPNAVPVAT